LLNGSDVMASPGYVIAPEAFLSAVKGPGGVFAISGIVGLETLRSAFSCGNEFDLFSCSGEEGGFYRSYPQFVAVGGPESVEPPEDIWPLRYERHNHRPTRELISPSASLTDLNRVARLPTEMLDGYQMEIISREGVVFVAAGAGEGREFGARIRISGSGEEYSAPLASEAQYSLLRRKMTRIARSGNPYSVSIESFRARLYDRFPPRDVEIRFCPWEGVAMDEGTGKLAMKGGPDYRAGGEAACSSAFSSYKKLKSELGE
jgi:hypothetical protein